MKKKRLRFDKVKRHFRHVGGGTWVVKSRWRPFKAYCDVCREAFHAYKFTWDRCDKYLKRIPPYASMGTCCSQECLDMYRLNPLAYD